MNSFLYIVGICTYGSWVELSGFWYKSHDGDGDGDIILFALKFYFIYLVFVFIESQKKPNRSFVFVEMCKKVINRTKSFWQLSYFHSAPILTTNSLSLHTFQWNMLLLYDLYDKTEPLWSCLMLIHIIRHVSIAHKHIPTYTYHTQ